MDRLFDSNLMIDFLGEISFWMCLGLLNDVGDGDGEGVGPTLKKKSNDKSYTILERGFPQFLTMAWSIWIDSAGGFTVSGSPPIFDEIDGGVSGRTNGILKWRV